MTLRLCVAHALVGLLFVLNIVSVSYPLSGLVKAPFFLMAIYYWSIYRPTLMPAWVVFIAGCLMDFISGFPLGLSALLFLAVRWLVSDQRRFLMGQNFMVVWFGYMIVSAAFLIANWGLFSLINMQLLSLKPLWVSLSLGIVLFPIVCILLHLTHKILPAPRTGLTAQS